MKKVFLTVIAAAAIISLASCGGNSSSCGGNTSSEKTLAEKVVEYLEAAQDAKGDMDWKKNNEINNECAKWYFDLSHDDQMAVNDAADAWQKANKKSLSSFLKRCLRGYKGLEQCLSHREEDPVSYQMSNF